MLIAPTQRDGGTGGPSRPRQRHGQRQPWRVSVRMHVYWVAVPKPVRARRANTRPQRHLWRVSVLRMHVCRALTHVVRV
jgi:hypothetical protein